jgi:predicted nucleotidyltransferase
VTAVRTTATIEDLPTELSLTRQERRVVEGVLGWLRPELGDELLAVWLFGSRARGEADLTETDPDRRSDVDLMLVVGPDVDALRLRWDLAPRLEEIADSEGDSPVWYSVRVYGAEQIRRRREIESFFLREVDRDKVVLFGDGLDEESAG